MRVKKVTTLVKISRDKYLMKKMIVVVSLLFTLHKSFCQQKLHSKERNKFEANFKVLDSLSLLSKSDTIYNCLFQVYFMEKNTGIEARTDGNYIGRFSCTKQDLEKWHKWYAKKIE